MMLCDAKIIKIPADYTTMKHVSRTNTIIAIGTWHEAVAKAVYIHKRKMKMHIHD